MHSRIGQENKYRTYRSVARSDLYYPYNRRPPPPLQLSVTACLLRSPAIPIYPFVFFPETDGGGKTDFQGSCPRLNECSKQKNATMNTKKRERGNDATARGVASSLPGAPSMRDYERRRIFGLFGFD